MIEPRYQDDRVTLYCGDCLEILPQLEAGSVDVVLTSPPYNVGLRYSEYNDKLDDAVFRLFVERAIIKITPLMSEGSRAYFVVSDKMIFWLKGICENYGLTFAQMLEWCKPNLVGGSGKISGDWNYLVEHIMLFRRGKRTPMLNGNSNTHNFFVIPTPQNGYSESVDHPAQFPVKLTDRIISRTPGDTILDCFMGSGTVGISAIKYGRKFIGIEISEHDYAIAEKRIREAQRQIRMDI